MAKRKQRGASFGKRSGGASQTIQQAEERRRIALFTCLGVGALLLICFIGFGASTLGGIFSRGDEVAETTDLDEDSILNSFDEEESADDGDAGFEGSAQAVDEEPVDDGGFSAEDSAVSEEEGFESDGFSADVGLADGDFSLVEGDGYLLDLDPLERDGVYEEYPEFIIDESKTYEALFVTERGEMRIRLFDDAAPLTVNNFVFLALDGFYDGTTFHRVIDNFMAQGGDPSGTGRGGPGYQFEDEVNNGLSFDRPGLLAMANAGPATNGSQFFITFAPTPHLDNAHTIFGELVEGEDVLNSIRIRNPVADPNPGDVIETIEIYVTD